LFSVRLTAKLVLALALSGQGQNVIKCAIVLKLLQMLSKLENTQLKCPVS
jgi:hypothetical protein